MKKLLAGAATLAVFQGNLLSDPGDDDGVYTISIDGTGPRRLTTRAGFDGDVRYSPDGRTLVFDSDRTGNADLFVMRSDGTHVQQLTHDPSYEYSGSFSPDGKYIAFVSERDSSSGDIFWMRPDGSQQTNITRTPSDFEFEFDPSGNRADHIRWQAPSHGDDVRHLPRPASVYGTPSESCWAMAARPLRWTSRRGRFLSQRRR